MSLDLMADPVPKG